MSKLSHNIISGKTKVGFNKKFGKELVCDVGNSTKHALIGVGVGEVIMVAVAAVASIVIDNK